MFQFNFNKTPLNTEDLIDKRNELQTKAEHFQKDEIIPIVKEKLENASPQSILGIKYLTSPLIESNFIKDISDSDLKANVYEGGFKIWECTFDLLDYLKENVIFENASVLDLGCGAGLLGLYALANKAKKVSFQDYNREVIEEFVVPNVILNSENKIDKCDFYHGDWSSLPNIVNTQFDIILTSETIYNINNYTKLIHVFKNLLKPKGTVYIAAKVYYFGVGGCITDFEKILEEKGFSAVSCWEQNEGVKRKIIKVVFTLQE